MPAQNGSDPAARISQSDTNAPVCHTVGGDRAAAMLSSRNTRRAATVNAVRIQ
jgi:hypothetical protein